MKVFHLFDVPPNQRLQAMCWCSPCAETHDSKPTYFTPSFLEDFSKSVGNSGNVGAFGNSGNLGISGFLGALGKLGLLGKAGKLGNFGNIMDPIESC